MKKTKMAKVNFKTAAQKATKISEQEFIEKFDMALAQNNLRAVQRLIEICHSHVANPTIDIRGVGASAHMEGATPLMLAAAYGHTKIVDALLKAGAYTELKTLGDNPMTAAQIASRQGHNKIAEKINKASKGLDEKSQSWQETLQHLDKQLSTPAGRAKFEANNVAEYWRRFDMGG